MRFKRIFLLLVLWLVAPWAAGDTAVGVSLAGPEGEFRERFAAGLRQRLGPEVELVQQEPDLIVALGNDAFVKAAGRGLPVFGVYVDQSVVLEARGDGCRCTAVWPIASPAAQLGLIRALIPGARRVGVLHDHHSDPLIPEIRREAARRGLHLVTREVLPGESPVVALAELMPQVDLLLAVPDVHIFNASTARLLLMTSYRHGRPVIGPDEQWVRAGSLASAWVGRDAILEELVALMLQYLGTGKVPQPTYAAPVAAVNEHVARAHGVAVPDGDILMRLMEEVR